MKWIVFDISNMLYRTFFANTQETDTTIAGLATHMALMTLNKYYKQHRPDKVVMAFDRKSWRKDYTTSSLCISGKPYKGNRRKDMSPAQQLKYERFLGHLKEFESLVIEHSTIITLVGERLEADDLIAGFVQANTTDEIILISSDSDLHQLLKYPNVTIISPANDKKASLEEYNNDANYYLFQKCLRGDATDNIQSAFPRIQTKRIEKAYKDPFEKIQVMKETWKHPTTGKEFRVEELFEENELLIDLSKQPEPIKQLIQQTIEDAINRPRKFSHFHFMKYLGKYELDAIARQVDNIVPLLSS
jgi:hypothetical protein